VLPQEESKSSLDVPSFVFYILHCNTCYPYVHSAFPYVVFFIGSTVGGLNPLGIFYHHDRNTDFSEQQ
jgi:hypothetical protein